jgi:tetratricopeptide (TPR) repeat protein
MRRTPRRTRAQAAALLLALGCAASGKETPPRGSVAWLVQHQRYDEAVRASAQAVADDPDDPARQADHRRASIAWFLQRGREHYLEGETLEALGYFRQAEAIDPIEEAVQDWILAAQQRLADQAYARGLAAHVESDFATAIAEYETAQGYLPGHARSRAGLARVLVQQNYRSGMGKGYYDEGIVALDRYFLYEAATLFDYVLKYQPDNERAELRGEHAQDQLAEQRAALALDLEEGGQYAAARNEFRLALLLDPELELAQLGMARARREEQVAEHLREVARLLLRERFDEAETLLEAQVEATDRQADAIAALRGEIAEARLDTLYDAARTLESDGRYAEAVEAYDVLLENTAFHKDALARRDTLTAFVRDAEELYARYEAAADDAERLALLRQIAVFWPEYRDVRARLAALE